MKVWRCEGTDRVGEPCTGRYRVRLSQCPRCRGSEFKEEELMPKISRAGGASNGAADQSPAGPQTEDQRASAPGEGGEGNLPADAGSDPVTDEGGEPPSPGTSSSTSSAKPSRSSEPNAPNSQRPARTTASRSGRARTGSSTVPSMAGDRTGPTSDADGTASGG